MKIHYCRMYKADREEGDNCSKCGEEFRRGTKTNHQREILIMIMMIMIMLMMIIIVLLNKCFATLYCQYEIVWRYILVRDLIYFVEKISK